MKRYLHEKQRFLDTTEHQHVLIVPGARTSASAGACCRTYTVASPIVPKTGGYRALLNLRAIDEILERERPDIIESADPYQLGWHVARAAQRLSIPAVAFYHSHFYDAYFRRIVPERWAQRYARSLYNRFETTLVASRSLANELEAWGVKNLRVQPLGLDAEMFRPRSDRSATRQSLGIAPDAFLLLYVGRLSPEKNVAVLFDAFQQIAASGKIHLLVIGDGPERAELADLKARNANVTSLNYCADPAELACYYRAADLLVHPGQRETFGLAAIEAQACGTPVMGIGRTRLNEVVAHDQSWWPRENAAGSLAGAIPRARSLDLRAIGTAASEQVRSRFAWQAVFGQLLCIYREVCANYEETR